MHGSKSTGPVWCVCKLGPSGPGPGPAAGMPLLSPRSPSSSRPHAVLIQGTSTPALTCRPQTRNRVLTARPHRSASTPRTTDSPSARGDHEQLSFRTRPSVSVCGGEDSTWRTSPCALEALLEHAIETYSSASTEVGFDTSPATWNAKKQFGTVCFAGHAA